MQRQIVEVYAKIVDADGVYSTLEGYPKVFDSKLYDNDIDKTLLRANGEFSETYSTMCNRDDCQLQMVMLMSADGFIIDKKCIGMIAELPDEDGE